MEDRIFKIADLKRDSNTGIVLEVIWEYGICENGNTATIDYRTVICDDVMKIDTNSETFVEFQNLTESVVIDWLKNTLTPHQFKEMDAAVRTKLPSVGVYGTPWDIDMSIYT